VFALRGFAISFAVFAVIYAAMSVAVCCTWRKIWSYSQRHVIHPAAGLLFALRVVPVLTAIMITAAVTVPSFLLLEPRAIVEPLGIAPLLLGLCGAGIAVAGIVKAASALGRASAAVTSWTAGAQSMNADASVPVLRISGVVPPMAAIGILRQRVLLSSKAEFILTSGELRSALKHELVHVRRRDNLKKLLLRFVAFPGMNELEAAWVQAIEMEADDAAVSNAREALDLAAALVKVSRISPLEPTVDLTAALVRSSSLAMNARVARLISWSEKERQPEQRHLIWYGTLALAVFWLFAITYSQWLFDMHKATEWLVR
jgi:beta-lactamase regulating signal transducer with metallopeptidase domain